MSQWIDPRYGTVHPPNCSVPPAGNRVDLRLDFGRGYVITEPFQSGCATPLLRAVLAIKAWRGGKASDPYKVVSCGTYACRPKRTASDPSMHSWPVAIDLNCNTNSLGGGRGDMPNEIIRFFEDEGFVWGGEWGDPMHFERTHWYGAWDGSYPKPEPTFRELVFVRHMGDKHGRPFKTPKDATDYLAGLLRADWEAEKLSNRRRRVAVEFGGKEFNFALIGKATDKVRTLLDAAWQGVQKTGERQISTVELRNMETHLGTSHVVLRRQAV